MCSRSAACELRWLPRTAYHTLQLLELLLHTALEYHHYHDHHDYLHYHHYQVIAAHRAGVTRVLLPAANEKDLHDLPEQVKAELSIVLVRTLEEALPLALEPLSHKEPLEEAKEAHEVAIDEQQQQQQQTGRTQGVLASRL